VSNSETPARQRRAAPPSTAVYVIRLRAVDNAAALHGLRWLLKAAGRSFGLKALSVTKERAELVVDEAGDG
jgi:hypothetical protein